jgi:dTDP-4-amino-4,6-dideoxygalactose transaminase
MKMYVPTWPGLAPEDVTRRRSAASVPPFPFSAETPLFYYRERNALYHLFAGLRRSPDDWVAVPDYHHGNEVKAIRAAGFGVRFYPSLRDLTADPDTLMRLCEQGPRAVLLIHYLGWAQPLEEILALCRRLGVVTVEDCALSLLSEHQGAPLGSRGDHALFCLYKTLPVPNGGMLVSNAGGAGVSVQAASASCGVTSVVARTLDLALEGMRGRGHVRGATLADLKARLGGTLTRAGIRRWPVGDDGFDTRSVDLRISGLSEHLLRRFDYDAIRRRRRENFIGLRSLLGDAVTTVRADLAVGMCPLFFPILVPDKAAAARALWARGIGAVEFWNTGDPAADGPGSADARFLRAHVLELPIHQDLRPEQLAYMATEVQRLDLRMAS